MRCPLARQLRLKATSGCTPAACAAAIHTSAWWTVYGSRYQSQASARRLWLTPSFWKDGSAEHRGALVADADDRGLRGGGGGEREDEEEGEAEEADHNRFIGEGDLGSLRSRRPVVTDPTTLLQPCQTTGPDATERAGAALAEGLRPGDVVLVSGDLGAGKTTFVRGALRALGVSGPVTSPTFVVGHAYEGAAGPGLAPRPLPPRRHGRRGPGAARPVLRARRDRLRRVARARARRLAGRARRPPRPARPRGRRRAHGEVE